MRAFHSFFKTQPKCHLSCQSEFSILFSSVQSLTRVWLFVTSWTAAHQASLSIANSRSLFRLISIESVMTSHHLILCRPLLLLPSIFPCIRVFSNESAIQIKWPKYRSFSFSTGPSSKYSGLIYFMIDWFDLLTIQEILQSLVQHNSIDSSLVNIGFSL